MARIPAGVIERLKSEIAIERLAEARGVVFERRGADLHGRCPFHEDKTPSLVVTPSKNLWHCLGACQAGGTVIDWVMKAEGVSFRHAVELLLNDSLPLAAASGVTPPKHSTVRKLPAPIERNAEDARLLAQVIDYYHETLLASPEALEYLARRGIGSQEAIRTFRIGYANRTLGYRLPARTRVEGAAIRGQLQRIGLWRESGHEHFNGSIVIPVIAPSGEVTEVYGRKITHGLRPGTPLHLYLPGPHRGVWNAAALTTSEVILCEALIDALTFWCAGYRNVTASYGVEGFTAEHLATLKHQGTERVLIAYDRDEAGDLAAGKLAEKLLAEGLDCYRVLFPKGMDANEYALKVTPAVKSLGVAIRSAQWMGKGKPKSLPASIEVTVPDAVHDAAPDTPLVAEEAAKEESAASEACAALPAQALPDPPAPIPAPESKPLGHERELVMTIAQRRYRVRGLEKNLSYEILKVNLMASAPALDGVGEAVHVDTLDLYHARARTAFVEQAAIELGVPEEVIKGDLGKVLLALEAEQEKLITAALAPRAPVAVSIEESARARAMELLKAPDLIERIVTDFSRCGIVGEGSNALVGYLAAISRKLDRPLALLIQSSTAAGKSSLLDAILRFVPIEDRIVYSAMTGQSLYYMGEMDLKHKLLAIAEEQGASRASYALKLLQSEGELTIASTSKDATTGKLETQEYRVEGPVMIALTTTAAEVDEELLNRCLVLSINEGRVQTQAIHAAQRERRTLAGLHARTEREAILKLHQDAQRLLEPLAVVNPYAHLLTFLDDRTRTRRDHEKYLTLIDVIALLHQHQRVLRTAGHGDSVQRYVEVTLDDIALANRLAHEILGRTLDELPPQTRRLLGLIVAMVDEHCRAQQVPRAAYRFSRRRVREVTKWGDTQLKIHLARLTELEYLLVHRGGRGQSFEYELLYDGAAEETGPRVSGLIDVEALRQACGAQHYDAERSGSPALQSALGRGAVGGPSGPGREDGFPAIADETAANRTPVLDRAKTHGTGNGAPASYVPLAAHA
jgi:CHC2-type zinc finger protein/Toprim domain-containing protein